MSIATIFMYPFCVIGTLALAYLLVPFLNFSHNMSTNNVYYYTNQQNKCHVHLKNTAVLFTVSSKVKVRQYLPSLSINYVAINKDLE